MTVRWANHQEVGSGSVFEALHSGLTVQLIATNRDDLVTCKSDETVSAVVDRNTEQYDFIPVISAEGPAGEVIIGLFHAEQFRSTPRSNNSVEQHLLPLSEDYLVGADASILDFVTDADSKPCRMVLSGPRITGLVSLSDLQKLPVRAALFALVTGFEIVMLEAIRRRFARDEGWMAYLSDGRRELIKREIADSKKEDAFVNSLLFTQFCDKTDIVRKSFPLSQSKAKLNDQLTQIQKLRDKLAHANEYAASPADAKQVCRIVRSLLALKDVIAKA
jgi:CBS domain-containing protein